MAPSFVNRRRILRPLHAERRRSRRAAGFSILEVSAGVAMLAILLTLIAQLFAQVRQHTRRTTDRAAMLQVVENLMEEATAAPWSAIDASAMESLRLPDDAKRRWPSAELRAEVVDVADPVAARQVTLTLIPRAGAADRPVALTTWIFPAPEN